MIKYCKNKINSNFGKEYKVMIQILIKIFESLIFYKNYKISIIPRKKIKCNQCPNNTYFCDIL